jgi:hypothetical protein
MEQTVEEFTRKRKKFTTKRTKSTKHIELDEQDLGIGDWGATAR